MLTLHLDVHSVQIGFALGYAVSVLFDLIWASVLSKLRDAKGVFDAGQ